VWTVVAQKMQAVQLFGANQSHGANGVEIKKNSDPHQIIKIDADFLCTQQKGYGLAVTTADCVPVVFYDPIHHAVVLVHAGWKGLCAGVVHNALHKLQKKYNTQLKDLEIFIGPCARACCYEVQEDVVCTLEKVIGQLPPTVLIKKDDTQYVDLAACVQIICSRNGCAEKNMYTQYSICTICNVDYCSYRRQKNMFRNITAVVLNEDYDGEKSVRFTHK
jgi:YfiH family protein